MGVRGSLLLSVVGGVVYCCLMLSLNTNTLITSPFCYPQLYRLFAHQQNFVQLILNALLTVRVGEPSKSHQM